MSPLSLPLHPLVVHLTVVAVPLAAVGAGVYGVARNWRWALRWPLLATAAIAAIATQVAAMTGDDLKHQLHLHSSAMELHESWAGRLQAGTWVLAAVVLLAVLVLPVPTRAPGGRSHPGRFTSVAPVLAALLPILALVELYVVFRTGDAGAQLVWAHA